MKKKGVSKEAQKKYDEFINEIPALLAALAGILRRDAMDFSLETVDAVENFYRDYISQKKKIFGKRLKIDADPERLRKMICAFIGEAMIQNAGGRWVLNDIEGDPTFETPVVDYINPDDPLPCLSPQEQIDRLVRKEPGIWRSVIEYAMNPDVLINNLGAKYIKSKHKKNGNWDRAELYFDGAEIDENAASRHIYFVLRWLHEKGLLKKSGSEWLETESDLDVGIYRDDVKKEAHAFLDGYYRRWYEENFIINFQIDPDMEFQGSEGLDELWEEFQRNKK